MSVFDVSHVGRLRVSGEDAIDLLDRLSTNDLRQLAPGEGIGSVLTTNKGRVIDLLRILHQGETLLVLTSHGTVERVMEWIDFYTFAEDVSVSDITGETSQYVVVGEAADEFLAGAGLLGHAGLLRPLAHTAHGEAVIVRADIGTLTGYEVILQDSAETPWSAEVLSDPGDLQRIRIEQGLPAAPSELNEDHNPLEANLEPYISFNKGCYIGQEVVARLHTYDRIQRFLCQLVVEDGVTLPAGSGLVVDGAEAGTVTSSIPGLSLAYLRKRFYENEATVQVDLDGGPIDAVVRDIRPPE